MAKTRTIILNIVIIAIALTVILIIIDMVTNIFGNKVALTNFFNDLLNFFLYNLGFLSLFPYLYYLYIVASIIFGIIIIWRRHKIKVYPFVILVWIYPIYYFFLSIPTSGLPWYSLFSYFFYFVVVTSEIFLPSIIITILALIFKKRKKRVTPGEVSVRALKPAISFPLERELIFISYATIDSDFFQIPKLTRILTSYPEIDQILYWESDMHDDIYRYMDSKLKRCKVVILFCSKNSLYSEAVNMEWSSALKLNKRIIPVFVEQDNIPALLTTKLGVQFKEEDPYSSIEAIYNMILKKLEVESVREFTRYIIPKWITQKDFEQYDIKTVENTSSFESDISSVDVGIQIGSVLQNNNFHVPGLDKALKKKKKKKKQDTSEESIESKFQEFTAFTELRDDPEVIELIVKIQDITDVSCRVVITAKGKRDWVLKEILRDIDFKLIELKSKTELIRNYSEKVVSLMKDIADIEKFLRRHLGSSVKHIEEILKQYKNKELNEEEFIIKATQSIGKEVIIIFLNNVSSILKEKKNLLESKQVSQTQIAF